LKDEHYELFIWIEIPVTKSRKYSQIRKNNNNKHTEIKTKQSTLQVRKDKFRFQ